MKEYVIGGKKWDGAATRELISAAFNGLTMAVSGKSLAKDLNLGGIAKSVGNGIKRVGGGIKNAVGGIKQGVSSFGNKLGGAVSSAGKSIVSAGSKLKSSVVNFSKNVGGKIKNGFKGGSKAKKSNQIPMNLQFFAGEGGGNKPPNLSPKGAGRNGAFREAKRKMGIPVNEQPQGIYQNFDKRGKKSPGTQYDFGDGKVIRDDSNGHIFPDDPNQNRGPHFNDPSGNHYDY